MFFIDMEHFLNGKSKHMEKVHMALSFQSM